MFGFVDPIRQPTAAAICAAFSTPTAFNSAPCLLTLKLLRCHGMLACFLASAVLLLAPSGRHALSGERSPHARFSLCLIYGLPVNTATGFSCARSFSKLCTSLLGNLAFGRRKSCLSCFRRARLFQQQTTPPRRSQSSYGHRVGVLIVRKCRAFECHPSCNERAAFKTLVSFDLQLTKDHNATGQR